MQEQPAFTSAICNLKSVIAFFLLVTLLACAAPSPPLPPSLELPALVTDLRAVRKGNKVLLTWTLPQQTTDGDGIRFHGPTRVCRAVLPHAQARMTECASPAADLASSQLDTTKPKQNTTAPASVTAHYADTLPDDWMRDPSAFVTYAIESQNTSHRAAGLSNQVRVPSTSTAPPPADFAAQLTAEGVVLTWTGPPLSITTCVPLYIYRVFRAAAGAPERTLVGEAPMGMVTRLRLVDRSFAWEKTYEYRVNVTTHLDMCSGKAGSLPLGKDSIDVEGEDSAPATIIAHDVFPPAVPAALQAVFSGAGQQPFIDLTWNANTEGDLAGYNIYRRVAAGQTVKISTDLIKAPAFRDTSVAAGQTYFYSVTAVDLRANESAPSEEASEQVP